MPHVFISYAHADSGYAHKLANAMSERGCKIWIDDRIEYGERWQDVLQDSIGNCMVFVIILSVNSKQSEWCKKELVYAQEQKKYILPVMLSGKPWLSLADTQYFKVKNGELPNNTFFDRILTLLKKKKSVTKDKDSQEIVETESRNFDNKQPLSRVLNMAQRSLEILEEQSAGYTNLTIPVPLKIQLEEKRKEVAELKKKLE